jgi:metallo-beta-lactamase family protein
MIRYLSCQQKSLVRQIFLVHGEEETKHSFAKRLMDEGYGKVTVPRKNEVYELE